MNDMTVLGLGPAACLLALALARHGMRPRLLGSRRSRPAVEGVSQRVVEALRQSGCSHALDLLGPRWQRVSCWNAQEVEMNGEFVVERSAFDQALLRDVKAAGIEVKEGLVRSVDPLPEPGRAVVFEHANGRRQTLRAALLADCRGHTAPKTAADRLAGHTLVSLGRSFDGARAQSRTTFIESFEAGWAWGGVDPAGRAHVQVVVLPELLVAHDGDLDAAHAACMLMLSRLPSRFGRALQPTGPARARGIQPALRGVIAEADWLRIGDAAYTCDPLSGHGMFEAASAAIAAVPVINTLLQRPQSSALALRYLDERAESVFRSRIEAAHQHYATETHWRDEAFWARMTRAPSLAPLQAARPGRASFASRPVVEDGYIVERRVVVSGEHPRGVRFIDGIDLGRLDELLHAGAPAAPADIGQHLQAPPEAVARALHWLQAQSLLTHAGH
ncbi:flavin-dependent monooxygenase QhpG [Methyloversatilis universalis]|uniref:flavin-dependent monooxygenase QhpG n=1 Tax=Methyloversatilis universalis TaxID=378211 RepID=UPI00038105F7|nr:tryptophan 7-halogenase [Methyloversatilis universalis]